MTDDLLDCRSLDDAAALDALARDGELERDAIECGSRARDWCDAPWGEVCALHTRDGDGRAHVWLTRASAQPGSSRPGGDR